MDHKYEKVFNVSNHQDRTNQNYHVISILTRMAGSHEDSHDRLKKEGRERNRKERGNRVERSKS